MRPHKTCIKCSETTTDWYKISETRAGKPCDPCTLCSDCYRLWVRDSARAAIYGEPSLTGDHEDTTDRHRKLKRPKTEES